MNSDELKEITQKMADVELPLAPDWQPLLVTLMVIIVAIVIAVVVIYLRSRRKCLGQQPDATREALYQLQQLQQAWQQHEIDAHEAAYRLATLLRLGLELNQLTETAPPSLQDEQMQWQTVVQLLTQLRYQPDGTNDALSDKTFSQIEQWLKRGNLPC